MKKKVTRTSGSSTKSFGTPYVRIGLACVMLALACLYQHYQNLPDTLTLETTDHHDEVTSKLSTARSNLFTSDGRARFGHDADKDSAPDGPGRFAGANYWDHRYAQALNDHYDWYGTWSSNSLHKMKPHMVSLMPAQKSKILQIGCGNSRLAQELHDDGYMDVTHIDISQTVVNSMAKKFTDLIGTRFLHMDATKLDFANETFAVIIEKGTLDAIANRDAMRKVVAEVFRALRPGGVFASMSFGDPDNRIVLNDTSGRAEEPSGWAKFQVVTFHQPQNHNGADKLFLYLMTKPDVPVESSFS